MKNVIRWGLAAGFAAVLALYGNAQAQSATGGSTAGGSGSSASGGSASGSPSDRSATPPTTPGRGDQQTPSGSSGTSQDTVRSPGAASGDAPSGQAGATGSTGSTGATGATGSTASGQAKAGEAGKKLDKGLQERLEKIHAAHQHEVSLARVATQNAESSQVKQFAQQMQSDHQKADEKLTQTAQTMGVSLEGETFRKESEKSMKDAEKLQSKTGKDFDKEYMSRMVKEHEKAQKEVDKAAKDAKKGNHTELASLLEQGSTGIKGHLAHAKQIEKSVAQGGDQMRQGRSPAGAGGTGSSATQQPGSSSGGSGTSGAPGSGSSSGSGEQKAK